MHHSRTLTIIVTIFLVISFPSFAHATNNVSRRDGFLLIWNSIGRPASDTTEQPYIDVQQGDDGFTEITYAKARGILDDNDTRFHPDEPLSPRDAFLLLLRTRSVERLQEDGSNDFMKLPNSDDVRTMAQTYKIDVNVYADTMTTDELIALMHIVDNLLASRIHEVSFYSEKFHGKGTAFGETFDMNALTAAHRSFPYNTLVRVTNVANGKSVVVRINDRGPFVTGRDMDLSLASFTTIADRSLGKILATFERLGDTNITGTCSDNRRRARIAKDVRLNPGLPHTFALGKTLRLRSSEPFVVRDVLYPDGTNAGMQTWITKGETYELTPSVVGSYQFLMGSKTGQRRTMQMNVVDCDPAR